MKYGLIPNVFISCVLSKISVSNRRLGFSSSILLPFFFFLPISLKRPGKFAWNFKKRLFWTSSEFCFGWWRHFCFMRYWRFIYFQRVTLSLSFLLDYKSYWVYHFRDGRQKLIDVLLRHLCLFSTKSVKAR